MTNVWDRNGLVEVEVEERPSRRVSSSPVAVRHASAARGIEGVQRAARVLRIVAILIAAGGVLGSLLSNVWLPDEEGYYPGHIRPRIGWMLQSLGTPIALAALVYAVSLVVTVYAARAQLERSSDGGPEIEHPFAPPMR